jgi:hypothetical protein
MHLAGIIPLAGYKDNFKLHINDYTLPIGPTMTLAHLAVLNCSMINCDTIWVVVDSKTAPFIRKMIGDYIWSHFDVRTQRRRFNHKKRLLYENKSASVNFNRVHKIPIFYIVLDPKEKDKWASLSWSILNGIQISKKISSSITTWVKPDKYYISFANSYSYHNFFEETKMCKTRIHRNFFWQNNGQTAVDGKFLNFCVTNATFKRMVRNFRKANAYVSDEEYDGVTKISKSRLRPNIAPNLELSILFEDIPIEDYDGMLKTPFYYDFSSWQQYAKFVSSEAANTLAQLEWKRFIAPKRKEINADFIRKENELIARLMDEETKD